MNRTRLVWCLVGASLVALPSAIFSILRSEPQPTFIVFDASGPPPPPKDESPGELAKALERLDTAYPGSIFGDCHVGRFQHEGLTSDGEQTFRTNIKGLSADQLDCLMGKAREMDLRVSFSNSNSQVVN